MARILLEENSPEIDLKDFGKLIKTNSGLILNTKKFAYKTLDWDYKDWKELYNSLREFFYP